MGAGAMEKREAIALVNTLKKFMALINSRFTFSNQLQLLKVLCVLYFVKF
jgi:hypothetical protein